MTHSLLSSCMKKDSVSNSPYGSLYISYNIRCESLVEYQLDILYLIYYFLMLLSAKRILSFIISGNLKVMYDRISDLRNDSQCYLLFIMQGVIN